MKNTVIKPDQRIRKPHIFASEINLRKGLKKILGL